MRNGGNCTTRPTSGQSAGSAPREIDLHIARARARFQAVLEGSSIPSLLVVRGGVAAANPAACALLGQSEALLCEVGLAAVGLGGDEWRNRIDAILRGHASVAQWPATVAAPSGPLAVQVAATGIPREGIEPRELVAVIQLHAAAPGEDISLNIARERYERLVDSAQEGIWEIDDAGVTVFANQRMAEILGLPIGELLGRSLFDFLDDDMAELAHANLATRRAGDNGRFDIRYRRADGEPVWAMVSAVSLVDGAGRFHGAAATVVDISERRRQESELRAAEERFRSTFDGAPIGMALVSLSGRWTQVNGALCRLLGRPDSELLTLSFQEVTHPDDLDADLALRQETVAGVRAGYSMEKRYLHADGRSIWVNLTVALLRDDDGQPLHFITQVEDITERKQMEVELRDARRQLEEIVASAAVAMALVSWDGTILDANPRFTTMFGSEPGLVGADLALLIQPEGRPRLRALLETGTVGRGGHVQEELPVILQSGATGFARFEVAPLPRSQPPTLVVQVLDVTRERVLQRELEHLAAHDPLTGALNRRGFEAQLDAALRRADLRVGVLYLDLDGFKAVNDDLGHEAGDLVLVDVAGALNRAVRAGDVVARLGGDEFAVLLHGLDSSRAEEVISRVTCAISEVSDRGSHRISASIGLAVGGGSSVPAAELVRRADEEMLEAKRRRRVSSGSGT